MNEVVIYAYDIVASLGVIFLVFVVGQTMNDPYHKRIDTSSVQASRKITFFSGAACERDEHVSKRDGRSRCRTL